MPLVMKAIAVILAVAVAMCWVSVFVLACDARGLKSETALLQGQVEGVGQAVAKCGGGDNGLVMVRALEQSVETLEAIAYAPYTKEQVQAKVAQVAGIVAEINSLLTEEEVGEISQAIVHSAIAVDIDPLLLAAMAIVESGCRPEIRGKSGEYGLLQIMPGTGKWVAGKLGYDCWEPADLMDVRLNAEISAYYLSVVTKEFGSVTKGVLAYNRGSTGARKWLAKHKPEEHSYVRKVMSTYQAICGTGAEQ